MLDTHMDDNAVQERKLVAWLERELAAKVVSIKRQDRWRPAWFVTITQADGQKELYVRGDRTSKSIVYPLEHEFRVMQVLEAQGIPVPHMYGLCPDPLAIVMARSSGRADLSTAESEEERRALLDQITDQLVQIHAIDVSAFEAAGLKRPGVSEPVALNLFEEYVKLYMSSKPRPDAMLEFFIKWVRRNVPPHRGRISLVWGDPAQFLFDKSKLCVVHDFELAHLGDPVMDLAALPLRDTNHPLGDLGRVYRRYMEKSGRTIDPDVFDYHTIQYAIATPLSLADSISRPLPLGALTQYMEWYVHFARMPHELMAQRHRVALPPLDMPDFDTLWLGPIAEGLIGAIRDIQVEGPYATYQRDSAAGLATYIHRVAVMGPAFQKQDFADAEKLLGKTVGGWEATECALEDFVNSAGPELDSALILFFYRRMQRQAALLEPVLARPEAAKPMRGFAGYVGS